MINQEILLSIVIVSHEQGGLVKALLGSLRASVDENYPIEIIIVENSPGVKIEISMDFPFPVKFINNEYQKGLSSNINWASQFAKGEYFCTINPDVIFSSNIFPQLIKKMEAESIDIIAPVIIDRDDNIQDSFRSLGTFYNRIFGIFRENYNVVIPKETKTIVPDWLAGIFLLMKSETFRGLSGFNERYFLYFEDVDFSCRARLGGYSIALDAETKLVHNAQRKSRKNLRFFLNAYQKRI